MPKRNYLNNKLVKRLLVIILVLTVGTPVVLFMAYRQIRDDPDKLVEVIKSKADMVFKNVEQTAIRDGINEWRLNAQAAYLMESQKKMVLEKPKVEFFLENGNNVFLTAQKGILNIDTKDIQVSGNVIVTQNSYTLKTKTLTYEHAKKELFTADSVQITGTRFDLTAGSMKIDLTSNQGLFNGGVTGVFDEAYSF